MRMMILLHVAGYGAVLAVLGRPPGLASTILAGLLIWISVVDALRFRIPDASAFLLAISGLMLLPGLPLLQIVDRLAGAIIWPLIFWGVAHGYLRKRGVDGLGFGDVKLMAGSCIWPLPLPFCMDHLAGRSTSMTSQDRTKPRDAGVTILEVLIVLAIIAMIAAVVGPRLIGYLGRAKSETAELQIDQIGNALQLFYIDTGRYPNSAEGLGALVTAPPGDATWQGPYLDSADGLTDPWGRAYIYAEPTESDRPGVSSLGRDGARGDDGEDTDLSL